MTWRVQTQYKLEYLDQLVCADFRSAAGHRELSFYLERDLGMDIDDKDKLNNLINILQTVALEATFAAENPRNDTPRTVPAGSGSGNS